VRQRKRDKCCFFSIGLEIKTQYFNPNPYEKLPINIRTLINKFAFRTWQFKRKASARSINRVVFPQPPFLVTMSN